MLSNPEIRNETQNVRCGDENDDGSCRRRMQIFLVFLFPTRS